MSITAPQKKQIDALEKTVAFLAKRDGIDKTLKIIRYSAKLALAVSPSNAGLRDKLSDLESSIGTSRKAYRLGKFLQNINAIRKMPIRAPHASLELLANFGECIYYFVDQFQWLVKIGILPKQFGPHLTKFSASGELLGYVASITLNVLRLHYLLEREIALIAELQRRRREREAQSGSAFSGIDDVKDEALLSEIRQLRSRRALRTLGLAQDLADALLALADLQSDDTLRTSILSHKAVLAAAGLVSGCISAYKNWPGVN